MIRDWGAWLYIYSAMMLAAVVLGAVLALRTGGTVDWTMSVLAVTLSGVLWLLGRVLRST